MISKNDLGERIRLVRKDRRLTLKELEKVSGFSATHISEIERGKTSPTIGALIKIAQALGKDPSFFLEEQQLSETAVTRRQERPPMPEEIAQTAAEYLTPGIPGGRLNAYMLSLEPGSENHPSYEPHPGEEGVYILSGTVVATVGGTSYTMNAGDALHYRSEQTHSFANAGPSKAEILLISTKRASRKGSTSGVTARI